MFNCNHNVLLKYEKSLLHVDGFEFIPVNAPKSNNRFQQYSMTNDPQKVWPGGIVPYVLDSSLSKFPNVSLMHDHQLCIITHLTFPNHWLPINLYGRVSKLFCCTHSMPFLCTIVIFCVKYWQNCDSMLLPHFNVNFMGVEGWKSGGYIIYL